MSLLEKMKLSKSGPDDCWNWTGAVMSRGYGCISHNGKTILAHRASYLLAYGTLPEDLCIMHTCDNRLCCNPKHLVSGTVKENNADRHKKGRSRGGSNKGPLNHSCKLTPEQALEVFYAQGSLSAIGKKYGLKSSSVYDIKRGRNWGWLTGANQRAGSQFR
jgi:hypothetical protein